MTTTPRPELIEEATQFMTEYSDDLQALANTPCTPPAPEPIDYAHAFRVWWHQAVNPKVPPSRTAAETHVLFAQHMVLVELERAGQGVAP